MIRYLSHEEIDKKKWDACIAHARNSMVYGYSWYLDLVSPGWKALVAGEYDAVMPLTWRKKFGFMYLFQPAFTQQLGAFGENNSISAGEFISRVPPEFRLAEISLNTGNTRDIHLPGGWNSFSWLTHHLHLTPDYNVLMKNYSENQQRNIKKARNSGFTIDAGCRLEMVIDLFKNTRGKSADGLRESDYELLVRLADTCRERKKAEVLGVLSPSGRLMAGALFVIADGKAIFLFSGTSGEARNTGALHFLIDHFIRSHSGSDLQLDFEGSNQPELARFYKGFGAEECVYLHVRMNRLPALVRWLKK